MEMELETLRENKEGTRGGDPSLPSGRRRSMKLEDVAVLGVGMTRFGVYRDRSNIDLAREAGLAALRDAGHLVQGRRRGLRRLPGRDADDRRARDEGVRAHRPSGHAHRERLGHRARRLSRRRLGGGDRALPGRDGARLRQDDGDERRARGRARRGPRRDRQRDPAGGVLLALGHAAHARARHQARALRRDRRQELELRREESRGATASPITR